MGLCEAETNVQMGDFVREKMRLVLIRVDSVSEGVQRYGLCDGVAGLKVSGHDAAGNWYWLDPCDWVHISNPVQFVRGQGLIAQAQFIVDHPEVWPELSEQLREWVEWNLRSINKNEYERNLQAKRVGGWEEDYRKNTQRRGRGIKNTLDL